MKVIIERKGNNCIELKSKGSDYATVQIWYESEQNHIISSDIKSELSAIAVAEIIREHLQVYVDIHSKSEPK